jgi:hypothetical protein
MADTEPDPAAKEGLDERVSSLETGQQSMTQKIDQILGIVGGGDHPDQGTDPKEPAGGTNVAHEIRQQLDERDAKARADAEKNGLSQTVAEVQAKVAELAEKPPAPMPRRVERFMGWS